MTDYPDWQTPQAHATSIANTGVPLLRMTTSLATGTNVTLAGGASSQLLVGAAVNQPGYEMTLKVSMPAGTGTKPFLHIQLLWFDGLTTLVGARRDYALACGNGTANVLTYYFRGPMHCDNFVVDVTNLDPAVTATMTWDINSTSHMYEYDEAVQYAYAGTAPNGFANPLGVPTTQWLVKHGPTIAGSGTDTVLAALYLGDCLLIVNNGGSAGAVTVELTDPAGFASGNVGAILFSQQIAAGGSLVQPLTLPGTPMNLVLINNSTVSISPSEVLIGQRH